MIRDVVLIFIYWFISRTGVQTVDRLFSLVLIDYPRPPYLLMYGGLCFIVSCTTEETSLPSVDTNIILTLTLVLRRTVD